MGYKSTVKERAFGSADFGATLRGVHMHLKALGGVVRLHGDSTSLYFGVANVVSYIA